MSNLIAKKDVVPYGIASNNLNNDVCLLPQNLLNWKDNNFAKDPIPIEQHLVLTVGSDNFTSSISKPGYHLPIDGEEGKCVGSRHLLCHRLWQFMGTVGLRAVQYNFNIHNSDKQVEEEDEENDEIEDDLDVTQGPAICYRLENGQYAHDHENSLFQNNFNNKSIEQQEAIIERFDIEVVTKEEYDAQISSWQGNSDSGSMAQTKQPFVVLLEFLRGKNDKAKCTGYRIWILKKKGGHGDLNQIVTEVLDLANKPAPQDRGNKQPENNWRKINTSNSWAEAVGSTLYKDEKKFLQDCTKYHLNDKRSCCMPTNILSVGHWRSVLCGTEDNKKEQPTSTLL